MEVIYVSHYRLNKELGMLVQVITLNEKRAHDVAFKCSWSEAVHASKCFMCCFVMFRDKAVRKLPHAFIPYINTWSSRNTVTASLTTVLAEKKRNTYSNWK